MEEWKLFPAGTGDGKDVWVSTMMMPPSRGQVTPQVIMEILNPSPIGGRRASSRLRPTTSEVSPCQSNWRRGAQMAVTKGCTFSSFDLNPILSNFVSRRQPLGTTSTEEAGTRSSSSFSDYSPGLPEWISLSSCVHEKESTYLTSIRID